MVAFSVALVSLHCIALISSPSAHPRLPRCSHNVSPVLQQKSVPLTFKVEEEEEGEENDGDGDGDEALKGGKTSPGHTPTFVCEVGEEHSCGLTAGLRDPFGVEALLQKCLLASLAPQVIAC